MVIREWKMVVLTLLDIRCKAAQVVEIYLTRTLHELWRGSTLSALGVSRTPIGHHAHLFRASLGHLCTVVFEEDNLKE